uniref:Uncharacterized protein n=1 Tax=Rhizophora mucronata TaxID=61149 RepID=A0A2P2Q7T4_RHIMU
MKHRIYEQKIFMLCHSNISTKFHNIRKWKSRIYGESIKL